jgi:hypothetical protein
VVPVNIPAIQYPTGNKKNTSATENRLLFKYFSNTVGLKITQL